MNIIAKAIKNNTKLKEYLENYNSEPEKANTENYQQIMNNDNLSWQEKYKLYSEAKDLADDSSQPSYVTNMEGTKGVVMDDMAARVSQKEGAREDPTNFLLMHAMGPNVAGVIGTAVAAGTFMAIFGV